MDETLRASLNELKKYANGDTSGVTVETDKVPKLPTFSGDDVKAIRQTLSSYYDTKVTPADLGVIMGVPTLTVENWESGKKHPYGMAVRLLQILDARPSVVKEVFSK